MEEDRVFLGRLDAQDSFEPSGLGFRNLLSENCNDGGGRDRGAVVKSDIGPDLHAKGATVFFPGPVGCQPSDRTSPAIDR
jgi:hypothetical protein